MTFEEMMLHLANRDTWRILYEVSGNVYEECGDYGEEVKE